jgi:hypothetical protein
VNRAQASVVALARSRWRHNRGHRRLDFGASAVRRPIPSASVPLASWICYQTGAHDTRFAERLEASLMARPALPAHASVCEDEGGAPAAPPTLVPAAFPLFSVRAITGNEDWGAPVSTIHAVREARVPGGCPDQV